MLFYDYEILPDKTTLALYDDSNHSVYMFTKGVDLSDTEKNIIRDYFKNPQLLADTGIFSKEFVERVNSTYNIKFGQLTPTVYEHLATTQLAGWNSKRYDSAILFLAHETYSVNPSKLRSWSDELIVDRKPLYKVMNDASLNSYSRFKEWYTKTRQLDVMLMKEKNQSDTGAEQNSSDRSTSALKPNLAYIGFNIKENETTRNVEIETDDTDLIIYNIVDTIGTFVLYNHPDYQQPAISHAELLNDFPKIRDMLDVDATPAKIATAIVSDGFTLKFKDYDTVNYLFPMPNGEKVDLLEYLRSKPGVISDKVYEFFDFWRGQSLLTKQEFAKAREKSPTGSTKVTTPFFNNDGNAIASYAMLSNGGSHGSTTRNIPELGFSTETNIHDTKALNSLGNIAEKKELNIFVFDGAVYALDFDSMYPTLLHKLGITKTSMGRDVYNEIREYRLSLKAVGNPKQKNYKLVLNAFSGDTAKRDPNAPIVLDNAILSMRLIGNLLTYALATEYVKAGVKYIPGTNTDGIEVSADLSPEKVEQIAQGFGDEFGMGIEPDFLARFIAKDSNNRVEYDADGNLGRVTGKLARGLGKKGIFDLTSKTDHPRVVDQAVVEYMTDNPNFTNEPIDRDALYPYFFNALDDFYVMDWLLVAYPSRTRRHFVDNEPRGTIRYVFGNKDTSTIRSEQKNKSTERYEPRKLSNHTTDKIIDLPDKVSLERVTPDNINVEPYVDWAIATLKTWINKPENVSLFS